MRSSFPAWMAALLTLFWLGTAGGAALNARLASDSDVYSKPDFNSPKIGRLTKGALVLAKQDKIVGTGGMGMFFKIKMPNGKVGYVTDSDLTDLAPRIAPPKMPEAYAAPIPQSQPTLWGFSFGPAAYSEELRGKTWNSIQWFYGARRTGGGAPTAWRIDCALLLSPGAPKFLSEAGASGATTGYIVLGELLMLKPVWSSKSAMLFGAAGPVAVYSYYSTNFDDGPLTSRRSGFGAELAGGGALKFDSFQLRLDVKLLVERQSYHSEILTFQMPL